MNKNPLTTLLSTSEGFVVILLIGVAWQIFGYATSAQTYETTTDNMIELGKWWLGARTALKGVETVAGGDSISNKLGGLLDILEKKIERKNTDA